MKTAAGKEIAEHRVELEIVILKIMSGHSVRCAGEGEPCEWEAGSLDGILCDLEEVLERYHVRRKAA